MSRQNKVNPGMYTQRGRLTQDDAARELRKQSSIGSQYTWQPVKKNAMPQLGPADAPNRDSETSEDNVDLNATPVEAETQPVSRATKRNTARKAAPMKARAKAAKTVTAKKTGGKAKTGKVTKMAAKRKATTPKRQAVLARNVGGGGATPRPATKRRKS